MPFLLPALSALTCDAVLLWFGCFHRTVYRAEDDPREQDHDNAVDTWVYTTHYLVYLAVLRVFLLMVPLLFHSYTGTALRYASVYRVLYWVTLFIVIVQMVGLALINPESLEALLPIDAMSKSSRLLHELRRLWWMLGLTAVANVCHLILLIHVRSTAPTYPLLASTSTTTNMYSSSSSGRNKAPSIYFQVRQRPSVYSDASSSSSPPEDAFMHAMSDFMDDVQARLLRAKTEWSARLEDFTIRISHTTGTNSNNYYYSHQTHNHNATAAAAATTRTNVITNPLAPTMTPFRVLLQLFAYQDVLENGKLDHVFDLDDGVSMTFWVPQLLSFLLHGALETSPQLEEWILVQCRRNIQFAHRCYWFLRAWCLEVPVEPRVLVLSRNNSESRLTGLAPFLDEPAVMQETSLCHPKKRTKPATPFRHNNNNNSIIAKTPDKFLPEEHALIERLMLRVKECGEQSAVNLAFGTLPGDQYSHSSDDDDSTDMSYVSCQSGMTDESMEQSPLQLCNKSPLDGNGREARREYHSHRRNGGLEPSPSKLTAAVESGSIPIDPASGELSVRHLNVMSSHNKFGFLPLEERVKLRSQSLDHQDNRMEHGMAETVQFDKTPHFLDTLLFLAEQLFDVPVPQRRDELRAQLRVLECELLPDNAVYIPIGNTNHRVWRIVPEESIPLGTKERVPCIITLEVIGYVPKRRKSRGWSLLPKRAHHMSRTTSIDSNDISASPTASRRPLAEVMEMDSTESELLSEWRYGRRDPYRRTAFFDKMTGTMKGATDKVSAQVRDKINLFRERTASEEMKSLKLADAVLDGVDALTRISSRRSEEDIVEDDVEASLGLSFDSYSKQSQLNSTFDAISRGNSSASLASMGQWSSPVVKVDASSEQLKQRQRANRSLDDSGSSSLPYGSDHETEKMKSSPAPTRSSPRRRPGAETSADVSSLSKSRPTVVFRESWKAKEDRIRQRSAYGSHPGWRLLPVLIKANDDLRQEQLASQLIYRMAAILARDKVKVWLCPYEIVALTDRGGIVEAIPDTISIDSLKRNDPNYVSLKDFFISHFGAEGTEEFAGAQANFVESLAAYSIVCFLLQVKDRHNGNILLDNRGHIIHIDFGFFFLSSPGSNVGFESAPFKLTRDFVELLGGPQSRLFSVYRDLCIKTFIALRRHCMEIILMVEMLKQGNEELNCFRGRPDEAIRELRERFRLDLNDRACHELVNCLIDDSIENWRTDWYDRYQRYFVGVL